MILIRSITGNYNSDMKNTLKIDRFIKSGFETVLPSSKGAWLVVGAIGTKRLLVPPSFTKGRLIGTKIQAKFDFWAGNG